MRLLVLGATGMAGHMISLALQEGGHDVTGFSRGAFPYCNHIRGDARDESFLVSILRDGGYDVVVNCIGVLNQECDREPSRAVYLNTYLPHLVADVLRRTRTKLIHLSTDCVFSGKHGAYREDSFPDGEALYSRSKALGEVTDERNLTLRTSIIGPDMDEKGVGLLNWFMKQHGTVNGYTRAIWTGVTTLTLAKAIECVAFEDLSGMYHLVNDESISKFELLSILNAHLKDRPSAILPNDVVQYDKSLVNTRRDLSFNVPGYEQMVIEMKGWITNHRKLYPHYFGRFGQMI